MNVLVINDNLRVGGGTGRVASNLANSLRRIKDFRVFLLVFFKSTKEYNVKVKRLLFNEETPKKANSSLKSIILTILRTYKLKRIVDKYNINTIITVSISGSVPALLVKLMNKKKLKVIISLHCRVDLFFERKINQLAVKYLYPHADKIITISKIGEEELKKVYKLKRVGTIYNFEDMNKNLILANQRIPKEHTKIFKGGFKFINIGRLTDSKGQWFLIRAFKKVVNKHPDAKLIILGEGELRNNLQILINELKLNNNIFLLGVQKNPFKFLKHSDCFVFSSLWEGLPMTLIEALSMSIPIISTDCKTGPREIICPELRVNEKIKYPYFGKFGMLTKPFPNQRIFKTLNEKKLIEEEEMLAKLMIKIIEDKSLITKYSNGLERAKDFDTKNIIKEWEKIILTS